LIAVRQAHEFRAAGRPPGVEQGADGVAIGSELKFEDVILCRERSIEVDHLSARVALAADHQDEPQRRHALDDVFAFLPGLRIVRLRRDHQHLRVFCDQQISYRVGGEQIIDRTGNTGDLGAEQGRRYFRERGTEEGDCAAVGGHAERPEEIGGLRYPGEQFAVRQVSRGLFGVTGLHHAQSRPVRVEQRGRLEHLVKVTGGYDLVVRRAFQRHNISDRLDGLDELRRSRRARHRCHRSLSCAAKVSGSPHT